MESADIKVSLLMRNKVGKELAKLKKTLRKTLVNDAMVYPGLSACDEFDAGPRTLCALGMSPPAKLAVSLDIGLASKLFPFTKTSNIVKQLPYVRAALVAFGQTDANMISAALATVRAETEGFVPIAELPSHINMLPGQAASSAYKYRRDNQNSGDGVRYRGHGYVQLTGCDDYQKLGDVLGIRLVENPDCVCALEVAACLLSAGLDVNREKLSKFLDKDGVKTARKVVNRVSYGHHEEKIFTRCGNRLPKKTKSASHEGFDNHVEIISKTLERITGAALELPVDDLVGF